MSGLSTSAGHEPILASWKISDVLRHYPSLLDELAGLDPAFKQLRNPLVRRVQARLVTVAQAAEIAGLEPAALVRALNAAAGVTTPVDVPPAAEEEPAIEPSWLGQKPIAIELDVRPLLQRGEEPFAAIMQAATRVPDGQILRLRAPFNPLPLYDVLARRGFTGYARQLGPDDWEVSFLSEGKTGDEVAPPMDMAAVPLDWNAADATITIDVSELVPPEPLVRIMEALERLPPGGSLRVHHVRRPMHLYPRLDERGYRHETRDIGPGRVELLIQKPLAAEDRE